MKNETLVGPWVRRFLLEHVVGELNLSHNTQASYRDALILLLPFVAKKAGRAIERLLVEDVSADNVRLFLAYLEEDRGCCVATRNQRLSAIHALARFIAARSPEHLAWCTQVTGIPLKRGSKGVVSYLEKPEMEALLAAPNRRTRQGARDHALLLFLYNSGARADEAAHVVVSDLDLGATPTVRILGKGRKVRLCPLWDSTTAALRALISDRGREEPLFLNPRRERLTRFGIYALVRRYGELAGRSVPSLASKRLSPHVIRHTTAVHLLRAGVDINTIRAWLGHVSVDTTNIYAEVDLEMKVRALNACAVASQRNQRSWHTQPDVMAFLKNLTARHTSA